MSAAVPGNQRDMLAFTGDTLPKISSSLDFLNIMTYDLLNRRDNGNRTPHWIGPFPRQHQCILGERSRAGESQSGIRILPQMVQDRYKGDIALPTP